MRGGQVLLDAFVCGVVCAAAAFLTVVGVMELARWRRSR